MGKTFTNSVCWHLSVLLSFDIVVFLLVVLNIIVRFSDALGKKMCIWPWLLVVAFCWILRSEFLLKKNSSRSTLWPNKFVFMCPGCRKHPVNRNHQLHLKVGLCNPMGYRFWNCFSSSISVKFPFLAIIFNNLRQRNLIWYTSQWNSIYGFDIHFKKFQ